MNKAMKALFALLFLILTVSGALAAGKNKPETTLVDNFIAIFDIGTTGNVDKYVSQPLTDR